MFGELPKLFDRNFTIAFFLPMTIFIGVAMEIINMFGKGISLTNYLQSQSIIGVTLFAAASWLGSIFLLVTNRGLYRFLEGYGKWNPMRVFSNLEKRKYNNLLREIERLDDKYRELHNHFPDEMREKRNKLMIERSIRFPDRESLLLPTPFGNTLRAFEVYPRIMYGLESIDSWSRLLTIIPKDYRELMDNAKTQVDFWVNLSFLTLVLSIEYFGLAIYTMMLPNLWIFFLILLILSISPYLARTSAVEWGDYIKAAFDIFSPKMREALGFDIPKKRDEEKQQWTKFSQAIIYRLPEQIPQLKHDNSINQPRSKTIGKPKSKN